MKKVPNQVNNVASWVKERANSDQIAVVSEKSSTRFINLMVSNLSNMK